MPLANTPPLDTGTPPRRRWKHIAAAAGIGALTITALVAAPASASHPEVSLPGSNFEIDLNANLKVDDPAPSIDWASVTQVRKGELFQGAQDDSFGQGSKEDTAVPTVVDGSIPPNKSDLLNFGLYLEEAATGDFLHLYWHRVQEPSGTTNMDFEFNKSDVLSANGVTPVRTAGDLLIQYDLTQGGVNPQLFLSTWVTTGPGSQCEASNSTPCWGERDNLTASGDATGSINTTPILAADSDGLGPISARTFGEATVDFDALGGEGCVAFGSAYLKSRSSDSFTAALKDFIAPTATGLNNCGALAIEKTRKHAADGPGDHPHAGVVFTITGGDLPAGTTVTTDANGEACLAGIESGTYSVSEAIPTGYAVTSANPQNGTVVEDTTCETATPVTFTNVPLTNITVSVDSQIPGGTASTIDCDAVADPPFDATTDPVTGDGSFSLNNKVPGTYVCTVIVDP
jgi:prealbumin domain-containing protein